MRTVALGSFYGIVSHLRLRAFKSVFLSVLSLFGVQCSFECPKQQQPFKQRNKTE